MVLTLVAVSAGPDFGAITIVCRLLRFAREERDALLFGNQNELAADLIVTQILMLVLNLFGVIRLAAGLEIDLGEVNIIVLKHGRVPSTLLRGAR